MRERIPGRAYYPLLDVSAWAVVTVTTVAAIGLAIIAVTAIIPTELPLVGGAAALLVIADGFAALRHMRAVRRAKEVTNEIAMARGDEVAARDRVSFARHAAALMAELPHGEGVRAVLSESLSRFAAEAAAIIGDENSIIVTADDTDEDEAVAAVRDLALETMKAGRSVTHGDPATDTEPGAAALTAPVRIRGELNDVLVLWRRGHAFRVDDLDGLSLVARIVELSMENAVLVDEVRDQLSGTLHLMIDLVEERLPGYATHSERVSRYASALGRSVGLGETEVEDLRMAGLLHDVGMLTVPESVLNSPRRLTPEEMVELRGHPEHGAELTRAANFPLHVQEAIRSHHERVDGMGYPAGLKGDDIPLAGRILNVCDAFVALISDRPHRAKVSVPEALEALRASAGTHYDADLVERFIALRATLTEA